MSDPAAVEAAVAPIVDWLRETKEGLGDVPLDRDLVDNRIIDSLSFMEFILLLESLIGRELSLRELRVEQFRTLQAIYVNFLAPAAGGPAAAR